MPAKRKLREEKQAMRLWDQHYRTEYIAAQCGVHPTTVVRWAHKNGKEVSYPYNRPGRLDPSEVVALRKRKNGYGKPLFSHRDIAEILGCSKSAVTKILRDKRQCLQDAGKEVPDWM